MADAGEWMGIVERRVVTDVSSLPVVEQALFLKQALEERLGIVGAEVAGEVRG